MTATTVLRNPFAEEVAVAAVAEEAVEGTSETGEVAHMKSYLIDPDNPRRIESGRMFKARRRDGFGDNQMTGAAGHKKQRLVVKNLHRDPATGNKLQQCMSCVQHHGNNHEQMSDLQWHRWRWRKKLNQATRFHLQWSVAWLSTSEMGCGSGATCHMISISSRMLSNVPLVCTIQGSSSYVAWYVVMLSTNAPHEAQSHPCVYIQPKVHYLPCPLLQVPIRQGNPAGSSS